jgi:fucose 4-O-acetylase-like acetyltransferase
MSRSQPRLAEIDLLKGWSILGVIFIHMSFASRFSAGTMDAITKLQALFAWAVVAFFFCSGFLFAKSSQAMQPIAPYAAKRAHRLLLPWLGFSILYKALLIAGYHAHLVAAAPPRQFPALLLWPGAPHLYFLPMLFLVSISFRILLTFLRQEWALALLALLLAAAYTALGAGAPHGGELKNLPAYAATYLAGILFANPPFLAPTKRRVPLYALIAIAFAALCVAQPTLAYLAVPLALLPLQRILVGPFASPISQPPSAGPFRRLIGSAF